MPSAATPRFTFSDTGELLLAYDSRAITIHQKVRVRIDGAMVETTAGRVSLHMFADTWAAVDMPTLILVLAVAGVLKNRRMTCYHLVRSEAVAAGGNYVDQEVVVDGNLVTSRAWPDHPAFMREFLRILKPRLQEGAKSGAGRGTG